MILSILFDIFRWEYPWFLHRLYISLLISSARGILEHIGRLETSTFYLIIVIFHISCMIHERVLGSFAVIQPKIADPSTSARRQSQREPNAVLAAR